MPSPASFDDAAFQAARAHFHDAVAELYDTPPRHIQVIPEDYLPTNETTQLRTARFFALIANLEAHEEDGWSPVQGFASASGEVVVGADPSSLGGLLQAAEALEATPPFTPQALAERLLFIFPEQGFLLTERDGYPEVAPPSLQTTPGGGAVLTAYVLEPGDMGRYAIQRLALTLEPDYSFDLNKEEIESLDYSEPEGEDAT